MTNIDSHSVYIIFDKYNLILFFADNILTFLKKGNLALLGVRNETKTFKNEKCAISKMYNMPRRIE